MNDFHSELVTKYFNYKVVYKTAVLWRKLTKQNVSLSVNLNDLL